jgi:hypothetical protein
VALLLLGRLLLVLHGLGRRVASLLRIAGLGSVALRGRAVAGLRRAVALRRVATAVVGGKVSDGDEAEERGREELRRTLGEDTAT